MDRNNPYLPPIEVLANYLEYQLYAYASELATGTGWAVHLQQDCQKLFDYNMANLFHSMQEENHAELMLTDLIYWFKTYTIKRLHHQSIFTGVHINGIVLKQYNLLL